MRNIELVFFLILPLAISLDTDYCYEDLCHTEELDHVTCDISDPPDDCDSPELIDLSKSFKKTILNWFNSLRAKIAMGNNCEPNMECPQAARMAEMRWDDELQYLAELYVKRCKFTDPCVNTLRFSNVAIFRRHIYNPRKDFIRIEMNHNFEAQIVPKFTPELIKSYNATGSNHPFWTQTADIAVDKNYLLGCAVIKFIDEMDKQRGIFACLMPTKAVEGQPIFQIGDAGSACTTTNEQYLDALCSTKEHYVVN